MSIDVSTETVLAEMPIASAKKKKVKEEKAATPDPSTGGYLKSDLVASKTFTAVRKRAHL